jgi:hypothetical protein
VVRPDGSINDLEKGIVGEWTIEADENGNFETTYQLDGIVGTYRITATDGINTATTTFTDMNPQPPWSVSVSPTSTTVPQGGSATATVSVTGPSMVYLDTGVLPTGVTVSFSPTSGNPEFTSTMSIIVGSTTTPGTYSITIQAHAGVGGGEVKATTTFTLIVTSFVPPQNQKQTYL